MKKLLVMLLACVNLSASDWVDHYVKAQDAISKKDAQTAISELSKAIVLQPSNLVLFVQRGQIAMKRKHWESAITDFTRVIEDPTAHPSVMLPALRGRAACYYHIDGMDVSLMSKDVVSRFENDFNNANLIDPYIFQTFENEKYLIDFNIPAGDFFDETYRGIIVQTALETDLCETGKDITFYDNRVIVKKKKKSACKKCEIQKNSLHCAPCEIAREVLNNNNPTDETDCQWWCNRVAQTAENMCVSSFQTAACRHTCMQVVQVAKAWCHKCCHADGFYQNCVKPFENFLESVGCEDAIW